MSIGDVSINEGNSGVSNAQFTVSLSAASGQGVTVGFATADGTATQPADYTAASGTLTFAPGQTTGTVTVPVIGETVPEANETFLVNLSGASNATVSDGQATGTIINDDVPVTVSPGAVPDATAGQPYSQTLSASGGTAPYSFAVTSGALPPGLSLNSSGLLSGTPRAGGDFTFAVTATDGSGAPGPFSGTRGYTLRVADAVIDLPSATLPVGAVGSSYNASIPAASGGTAPYTYATTAGQLPDGLTLNVGTGAISGTPTAAGSYLFDVTATDSSTGTGPFSATQSYAIEITDLPPVVNPVSLTVPYNSGPVNVPVSFSGGTPTSYGEVTSPTNGTVITLGTVITYQPNPGYAGPDSFTYNANNSGGTSASATVTITVSDPVISVSASGSLAAVVGAPYSQTFTWAGGTAPFSGFQVTGLPLGLTITASTANSVTISGTPAQAGSFSLNASASDSSTGNGPFTVGQAFTLTVAPPTLDLAPGAGVLTAAYATPFSQSFTASGGIGGYSYSLTGALPPGLSFTGGNITGTPTTPGSYSISVTATDSGATGTGAPFSIKQAYTIEVPSPVITLSPAVLANGTAAVPYAQTLSGSGGVAPLTFTLGGGTLPAGISLSAGGVLSGTPTEAGSFTFSVAASDANGQSGSRSYTLVIDGPALSLAPASGTLTLPYGGTLAQGFSASGGNGPYTYAISGSLPAGVAFDPGSGLMSGSTFVVGDFALTVTATDTGTSGAGAPFSVARRYTLSVTPPTLAIAPGSLPGATVGNSYTSSLIASGGAAPYSFALTGGALPTGLGLSPAGVISGTPSAGGTFTFTVTASDSGPAPGPFSVSRSYTLDVAVPVVALPATSLPAGQRGAAYSATLNPATGGTAPYTYAVTGGALPAGLGLSSGGSLMGTPTVFGNFSFAVTATDSSTGTGPYTATQSYTLAIIADPPVAGAVSVTLPYGAPSTPIPLNLAGGPASSVAVQSGPANGSASVSGTVLSYQPRAGFSGTDSLTYIASNDGGTSTPATITITVGAPSLSVTASGPLDAVVGAPYTQTFSFAGGSAPFRSPEVTGLPAGLALTGTTANSVTISGTPRSQGTFTLSVSATDSSTGNGPFTASRTFGLTVAGPDLSLTPATATFSAPYAAPFSQTFAANGGIGSYSYAVSGTLPAGLALDGGTGILSGSPTQTGSFAFTITATDTGASGPGAPFTVAGSYTLNVAAPTITVSPTALPNARSGTAYSVSLTGSGAVAPYTFTITGGALPAGLALASGGQIAGTPTASGTFPFEVTIRDANGQTSPARLTLTVDVPTLTVTPATLPNAVQGVAYSQTLTVSGGIAPYRFSIGSGSLPAGLSLDPVRGIISGTPTGSGTANFAVTVTDSTGGTPASATVAYSLQITARPDPARDPEVRGLTQAQVLASRRFADTQVNNFMRRLESMHGNARSTGGFQNGVRLTSSNYCEDTVTSWTSDICRKTEAQPGLRAQNGLTGEEAALGAGTGPVAAERPWTVWTGGTIRFGERDPATGIEGQDFESEGLSLGADYRFSPSFAAGVGIGFGRDTANVGENQSRSSGEATTIAIYGSYQLGSGIFLDWLGGYQWLDFDLRRYVTSTGALVNSNRSGNQWFVTGSAGADFATGNWQITPYARVDVRRGTLNGYTENSGSLFDLRFLDQDVDFTSLGLGTVVNYQHRLRRATLLPRLRIEYLYDVERSAEARVAYADLISGPFSAIPLTGISREQLTLGLGTEVLIGEALSLEFEYLGRIASGSGTDQSLQAGVSLKF
jgi:outer membrane autotransporter protein